MSDLVRKICLLGDFCVGKTSTVRRFVESRYDDKYLSTVGVKIDTKQLTLASGRNIKFVIWDLAGTDTAAPAFRAYLKGMAGYLLVVDGTRPETLDNALGLQQQLAAQLDGLPWIGLLNKADLVAEWALPVEREEALGTVWRRSSAKTGGNVEQAFVELAQALEG